MVFHDGRSWKRRILRGLPAQHTGSIRDGTDTSRHPRRLKGEENDMVRMLKRFLKGDNRVHIVGSWGF